MAEDCVMNVEIHNPRKNDTGGIDCEVASNGVRIPFTARSDDPEEHGREIYRVAAAALGEGKA